MNFIFNKKYNLNDFSKSLLSNFINNFIKFISNKFEKNLKIILLIIKYGNKNFI